MERLHVDGWLRGSASTRTEHIGCPFVYLAVVLDAWDLTPTAPDFCG
jgi:hypothetical protein